MCFRQRTDIKIRIVLQKVKRGTRKIRQGGNPGANLYLALLAMLRDWVYHVGKRAAF